MVIYHGTPITPLRDLQKLKGQCFCVSFARPDQIAHCTELGAAVLGDNGAFSVWKNGFVLDAEACVLWYEEREKADPSFLSIVPDVIGGSEEDNDAMIRDFGGPRRIPVWHMHESLERLERLATDHNYIAWGSSGEFTRPRSTAWVRRAIQGWNVIYQKPGLRVHMLRGLSLAGGPFPFFSADSTDLARNHSRNRKKGIGIEIMARKWDLRAGMTAKSWLPVDESTSYYKARQLVLVPLGPSPAPPQAQPASPRRSAKKKVTEPCEAPPVAVNDRQLLLI